MYYKIAVAENTNFVRDTCKWIYFSGSRFTIAMHNFPESWIPLQAFAKIVPSFQDICFIESFIIMTSSAFGYPWTEGS